MLTSNANYAQNIRVIQAAANSVPLDIYIEILGPNGSTIDLVKWAYGASPTTTWKKVIYAILAMIRK